VFGICGPRGPDLKWKSVRTMSNFHDLRSLLQTLWRQQQFVPGTSRGGGCICDGHSSRVGLLGFPTDITPDDAKQVIPVCLDDSPVEDLFAKLLESEVGICLISPSCINGMEDTQSYACLHSTRS
jgi:hypothetical protein